MPLYEYQCDKCGGVFELIEKFSDSPKTVHENCGGAVHRLISAPALQFKGTGWYITDYAKSGSSSSGPKGSESKSGGGDSKSGGGGESGGGSSSSSSGSGNSDSGSGSGSGSNSGGNTSSTPPAKT